MTNNKILSKEDKIGLVKTVLKETYGELNKKQSEVSTLSHNILTALEVLGRTYYDIEDKKEFEIKRELLDAYVDRIKKLDSDIYQKIHDLRELADKVKRTEHLY